MTTKTNGYNKDPIRATGRGIRFYVEYGFISSKSTTKNEDNPLLTKYICNCYLIIAEDYS